MIKRRIDPFIPQLFALGFSLVLYYFFLLPFDYGLPLPWLRHIVLLAILFGIKYTWRYGRWVLLASLMIFGLLLLSEGFRLFSAELLMEAENVFQRILSWSIYPVGDPPPYFFLLWSLISVLFAFVCFGLLPSPYLAIVVLALPLYLNFSIDTREWQWMLLAGFLTLLPLFAAKRAERDISWFYSPLLLLVIAGVLLGANLFSDEDLFSQTISDYFREERPMQETDTQSPFSLSIFGLYEGDAQMSGRPITDNTPYLSVGAIDFTSYLGIRKYSDFDETQARWLSETMEMYSFSEEDEIHTIESVFPAHAPEFSHSVSLQYRFLSRGPARLFHGGAPRNVASSRNELLSYNTQGELLRSSANLDNLYTIAGQYWDRDLLDGAYEDLLLENEEDYIHLEMLEELIGEARGVSALVALREYFQTNFRYDASIHYPLNQRDFVAWFLSSEEGFCVHYATAMALLAQRMGFEARYVEGFVLPPDRDTIGAYEAHAWAEILLPGYGWVPFDATPSSYQSLLVTRGAPAAEQEPPEPQEPQWEEEMQPELPPAMQETDPTAPEISPTEPAEQTTEATRIHPLLIGILLMMLLLAFRVAQYTLRHNKKILAWRYSSDARALVRSVLKDMERLLALRGIPSPRPWNAEDWMEKTMREDLRVSEDIWKPALAAIETSLYGPVEAKKEEVDALLLYYQRLEVKTRRELPLPIWLLRRVLLPAFLIQ